MKTDNALKNKSECQTDKQVRRLYRTWQVSITFLSTMNQGKMKDLEKSKTEDNSPGRFKNTIENEEL